MTEVEIFAALDTTGIPREAEKAVPINGVVRMLPYLVVRRKESVDGSDNGFVRILRTEWEVALFTVNKEPELNSRILTSLAGAGKVEVISFPDGDPYQTTFKFKTNQIM